MTLRRRALLWAAGGLLAPLPGLLRAQTATGDGLAGLDEWLEAQRTGWRVPGLAVALIKDGQVAYLRGFGHRDAAQTLPVDTDTLFRGGSTTKAFGAASVALLVDEGRLAWDAPVSTYIPEFRLAGGEAYASISLRDMLSHRTGLPRHDLLWYNNRALTRQGLVERLPYLETSAPLRARYQYNNLMVVTAGHAVERVTGMSWEAFVRARLLAPLRFTRANLSAIDLGQDANHAVGFTTGAARRLVPVPLRHDALLGPAGALNASIAEYARWVQLQLGQGQFEGRRLISTAGMAAMWEPLQLASDTPRQPDHGRGHVGLGWRIDRYRDTVRIAHGGDLNGFTSRVVLLPQHNAGLAILVNHGSHPLPNALTPDLLDRLLGLRPEGHSAKALARRDAAEAARLAAGAASGTGRPAAPVAGPSRPLAAYAGRYVHPGYGDVQVAARGGGLEVHYNEMPAALAHLHFDVFETRTERPEHGDFNALKLVFQGDEQGQLSGFSARLQDGVRPIEFKRSA